MHILIIDNDNSPSTKTINFLRKEGFTIKITLQVSVALRQLKKENFDLIIFKTDANSMTTLKKIREISDIPILALAAKVDTKQRMDLYKYGVDDYVGSKIDIDEFRFRIFALLRRRPKQENKILDKHILEIDNLQLNQKTQEVTLGNAKITLTPVQFRLLWVMASHQDKVLSKPFLYQTLFNRQYTRYDRGVDIHISRVRKKLDVAGGAARRLSTIHGQGYCFS